MTPSSLGAAERSRYPLLSLTSLHQSCPATALAIYSHVSSNCFRGCTNITKQAFAAFTIADIATINHSAPQWDSRVRFASTPLVPPSWLHSHWARSKSPPGSSPAGSALTGSSPRWNDCRSAPSPSGTSPIYECPQWDSNPRLSHYEWGTLTTEL